MADEFLAAIIDKHGFPLIAQIGRKPPDVGASIALTTAAGVGDSIQSDITGQPGDDFDVSGVVHVSLGDVSGKKTTTVIGGIAVESCGHLPQGIEGGGSVRYRPHPAEGDDGDGDEPKHDRDDDQEFEKGKGGSSRHHGGFPV